ncbi:MAG: hypothetical protein ACRDBP_19395 [Luteolibacter sp.]
MKLPILTLAALCLVSPSCEEIKNLADKAKSTVASEIAKKTEEAAVSVADPELQKLVDQTPEGTIFRKDLPFPSLIEVKINRREEVSGRFSEKSELGSQVNTLKGTITKTTKVVRKGDRVSYTLLESIFTEPVIEGADQKEKEPVVRQLEPPSAPFEFVKSGTTWKSAVATDFRIASRAQTIGPFFDQLLVENTLAPRTLWFGKKRYKVGDELVVSQDFLPMLVTGNAKGQLKLILESFDAVHGHPCGVFSVTGDFTRSQFPHFDGTVTNEEVTIDSGKLWLSLLYPLILREETDLILTSSSGGQGGLSSSGRSSAKASVIREWKGTSK